MLNLMIIHLVGLLSPGPDFFYVSRVSAMSSRREAIGGVIGSSLYFPEYTPKIHH